MMKKTLLAAAVCAACSTTPAFAQDDQNDELDEVIVTALPLGRDADSVVQPVKVLTKDELLLRAANSIGETLANEPGLSTTYFGPVAGRPIIRGQDGPRISVLDSGVGTLDVADLSPDHAVPIEPLFVDQVEILRGPATLLYGSNASGGVVNVIDGRLARQPAESAISGSIEARGDTVAESRAIAARLDGGNANIAWHVDAFTRDSENIDIDGFATADAAERDPEEVADTVANSYGEANGAAGGVTFFGEMGSFGVAVSQYETTYGLPGPGEEEEGEEEEGPDIFEGPFIDLEQTRIDLRGELLFDGAIESIKVRVGINDYEHSETEPNGEVATVFENEAVEARFEAVHREIGNWRGAFGLQIIDRDFSAVGAEAFIAPTQTNSIGLFLLEERATNFGRIELGARVENLEHESELAGSTDYDETAVSVAAGLVWEVDDRHDFIVNLSRSERNLDPAELYAEGPHLATGLFEFGLQPGGLSFDVETSTNLDIGWHHHGEMVEWKLNLFTNSISDYTYARVTTDIEDGLPVATFIQEDAQFFGFEAEADWRIDNQWNMTFLADYVRGETDTEDLPRIQAPRFGAALNYSGAQWQFRVDGMHHFEQDDVSSFATDSFTLVGASAVRRLEIDNGIDIDLFLKASNLLDEAGRRATSFRAAFVPIPGTNFEFGLRANFR